MNQLIGQVLRKYRTQSNLTVKEISELLLSDGINVAEKTIYSWENGYSQPNPSTLFVLCKHYGIRDISIFTEHTEMGDFTRHERNIISKYRTLDTHGRKIVDTVLDLEWKHKEITEKCEKE